MNFGAIFENFAAQELYAHGFATDDHNLFYFNSKKQGEVDFVIEKGNAIPIEIKSGKITYLPIYMLMCLSQEVEMDNPIYKLDMTGLS